MSKVAKAKTDPVSQFWDELDGVHAVMLGSPDHAQHMQPMAPQSAKSENAIWFFTRKDTDIAKAALSGGEVHMCLFKDDYQACLRGTLATVYSPDHIDRFWSSVTEAWFPEGKQDPNLTMLKLTPIDAAVWASTGSTLVFGWQIAKANLTGDEPDVGHHTTFNF